MDQRIINLYDEYTHQPLPREVFLKRLVKITGSMAAAMSILPLIETNYAQAAMTQTDELLTERISYDGANGKMSAYIARPKKYRSRFHSRPSRQGKAILLNPGFSFFSETSFCMVCVSFALSTFSRLPFRWQKLKIMWVSWFALKLSAMAALPW